MARQQRLLCLILCIAGIAGCSSKADAPDPTIALTAAEQALANDESPSEEVIASVLAIDTDDPDTQLRLAATSHAMGRSLKSEEQATSAMQLFVKAGEAMQKVEKSDKELSSEESEVRGPIYYYQACAYSLLGEPEKALSPLRSSVEVGYGDLGMFDKDSDLDAVRKLPEYPNFYAKTLTFFREQLVQEMEEFKSYPFDLNLTDLDGKPLVLSEMKGKVVVLDFWATWCRPCLMSMPDLNEIYLAEQSRGLEVIGLDYEGSRGGEEILEKVKQVLSELKIQYPCAIGDAATEAQVPNMESIPTMVFIDRTGKVRFQLSGAHSPDYLMAVIEPLLAEPAPE
jgi:thiol-disulfide isomerase/thioredoxin